METGTGVADWLAKLLGLDALPLGTVLTIVAVVVAVVGYLDGSLTLFEALAAAGIGGGGAGAIGIARNGAGRGLKSE
jgi:hypothetical protein